MVPPPPATSQYVQQFLSTVLSQRGPGSLPYAEDAKWLIRHHLMALVDAYPSLQPSTSPFTHNDGTTTVLLRAEGTIPAVYRDVCYNLPVSIWLPETYPRRPPSVLLNPTRDMVVRPSHPNVLDPSGAVTHPYLSGWVFPSSNLLDLVRQLSISFGRDPPLFSKQPPPTSRPNPSPNPSPNPNPSIAASPQPPPRAYSVSPYAGRQRAEDPAEVFRRNAINKLLNSVHEDLVVLRRSREGEVEGVFNCQAVLKRREEEVLRGVREMQEEREGLEQQLQMVLMNSDVLEGWVRENFRPGDGGVDVDDAFEMVDGLSRQMVECAAADMADDDVMYSLEKAVERGVIGFDVYMKNVRALSREQFFHRAIAVKVREAQRKAHVDRMASRAGAAQYVG
ncbi:Protein ELC [Acorus calamus]|uniref:Protein ELC n=1 Tax=Acorus calamus TaxID=4465 RepID=A0AAV9CKJ5_ACOCL|nr:Protein ELC [Acorus calamus]